MLPEQEPIISIQKPFAGRDALYARMQQQILDPGDRFALLFIGQDGIGKTRLIQQFPRVFQDTLLAISLTDEDLTFNNEEEWLQILVEKTSTVLAAYHFSLSRIQEYAPDSKYADWVRDHYLPEVLRVIRAHRRIVWLIDDAQFLLDRLPAEHLHYLADLLHTHQQLAIVLTLHTQYEERLAEFAPLVDPHRAIRIRRFSIEESTTLLRMYNPDLSEGVIASIFQQTAGHPRLVERYGNAMQEPATSFQEATDVVYAACEPEFRKQWQDCSRDEKHVLTAIASLRYVAPAESITAQRIHWWLTQSDYPLDLIAINAVIRALDYLDIASTQQGKGIHFIGDLLERWMVEHARDDEHPVQSAGFPRRIVLLLLLLAIVLLVMLFMFPTTAPPEIPIPPTVTLGS